MVRCKGLAQSTGVEGRLILILHAFNTLIAEFVDVSGFFEKLGDAFFFRVKGDFDLIKNTTEVSMEFRMKNLAEVGDGKALVHSALTDSNPGDITLSDMHDALSIIDQVVNLAFENRFEVGLELASRHLVRKCPRGSCRLF